MKPEALLNAKVLASMLSIERARVPPPSPAAVAAIKHWATQLRNGVLHKLTESSAEQTFNNEIFGTVLGYKQVGAAIPATMMPKRSLKRNTPDFVLGRFDPNAKVERWVAVGEIKDVRTDLDQPQTGRANNETPVEQAFRYAGIKAGVEWVVVTNLGEIRLYRNGYPAARHVWRLEELEDPGRLFEFYALLGPEGLLGGADEPFATRVYEQSLLRGRDLTEGFYGLYKRVQGLLVEALRTQSASKSLSEAQLYGKTQKLLNRILFVAFCEDHPAELVPKKTLEKLVARAAAAAGAGAYWREYKALFKTLNEGGGFGGHALNAFNGGLFAHDPYFDAVEIDDALFEERIQVKRGRRESREIEGIFGFQVYDFAEDLNEQALGAIFEQSLSDIINRSARVRGVGEVAVSDQKVGGVYYTPREVTSHLVRMALQGAYDRMSAEARAEVDAMDATKIGTARGADKRRVTLVMDAYQRRLGAIRVTDLACGSGAFLVEVLAQLHTEQEKTNRTLAELRGAKRQRSLLDLDRAILRKNLHGRDILSESVEISRLSIWLRTARRGEKLETLNATITEGDSLRAEEASTYDVVVGNPPWGAKLEGWSDDEIQSRFPDAGEEKDSYAIFTIRSWELLRPNGMLGIIIPNSWLTTDGYAAFRAWLLRGFEILDVTNTWKVFRDVNHDATMVVARKRVEPLPTVDDTGEGTMKVRALSRGTTEVAKLRQLAQEDWAIAHEATQAFQASQLRHRFEVIYPPRVAEEIDAIVARCARLDQVADVTVGIQAYHHTKVDKATIEQRLFHSKARMSPEHYPYVDANDVQRYFVEPRTTQWLRFSDLLRDKRDLTHYLVPRILVQQIFWQRLSAEYQEPSAELLYMNTLFAIYNPRGITLPAILGLINSRFVSAIYERIANRLFGDKFPKVSKLDLARLPIPRVGPRTGAALGRTALALREHWNELRTALRSADMLLSSVKDGARLGQFVEFWIMTEREFMSRAVELLGPLAPAQVSTVATAYKAAKAAVDGRWGLITQAEADLEASVRAAYRVGDRVYDTLIERVPEPTITWALRP